MPPSVRVTLIGKLKSNNNSSSSICQIDSHSKMTKNSNKTITKLTKNT